MNPTSTAVFPLKLNRPRAYPAKIVNPIVATAETPETNNVFRIAGAIEVTAQIYASIVGFWGSQEGFFEKISLDGLIDVTNIHAMGKSVKVITTISNTITKIFRMLIIIFSQPFSRIRIQTPVP